MSLFSDSPSIKPPAQSSSPMNTSVGSGPRPVPSRIKIETSAPTDQKTLGRDVPGSLK